MGFVKLLKAVSKLRPPNQHGVAWGNDPNAEIVSMTMGEEYSTDDSATNESTPTAVISLEGDHEAIEQVLNEFPPGEAFTNTKQTKYVIVDRSHEAPSDKSKPPVEAVDTTKPKYTKEEKQLLFMKKLFQLSRKHIPMDLENSSIVGTDVGSVDSNHVPLVPLSDSSVREFVTSMGTCTAFKFRCGRCSPSHPVESYDTNFSITTSKSDMSMDHIRATSYITPTSGIEYDHRTESSHGESSTKMLRVGTGGDDNDDACASTIATQNSKNDD